MHVWANKIDPSHATFSPLLQYFTPKMDFLSFDYRIIRTRRKWKTTTPLTAATTFQTYKGILSKYRTISFYSALTNIAECQSKNGARLFGNVFEKRFYFPFRVCVK